MDASGVHQEMKAETCLGGLCGTRKGPRQKAAAYRSALGFTLIELMAVILVVLVLAAIGLGVAGYVQKKVATATTKSQLAAVEAALESYKSDWGYYPQTTTYRISTDGEAERTNNWYMVRALSGLCNNCTKSYMKFPAEQLRSETMGGLNTGVVSTAAVVVNFVDVFGKPFNYYNAPHLAYNNIVKGGGIVVVAGYGPYSVPHRHTTGGQMNQSSYDLFSYGPDNVTYYGTNVLFLNIPAGSGGFTRWHLLDAANDDIMIGTP